jgi:hypothetical protein
MLPFAKDRKRIHFRFGHHEAQLIISMPSIQINRRLHCLTKIKSQQGEWTSAHDSFEISGVKLLTERAGVRH